MNKQVVTGTLVLVAPEGAPEKQICETVNQAATVHNGPVVVLPHNWAAMPVELVRAQLAAAETQERIGPSKPPPPPPACVTDSCYALDMKFLLCLCLALAPIACSSKPATEVGLGASRPPPPPPPPDSAKPPPPPPPEK